LFTAQAMSQASLEKRACNPGFDLLNGKCVRRVTSAPKPVARPTPNSAPRPCAANQERDAQGRCIRKCALGYRRNETGNCVELCPPGQVMNVARQCVASLPTTPSGGRPPSRTPPPPPPTKPGPTPGRPGPTPGPCSLSHPCSGPRPTTPPTPPPPRMLATQLQVSDAVVIGIRGVALRARLTADGRPVTGVTVRFVIRDDGYLVDRSTQGTTRFGVTDGNGWATVQIAPYYRDASSPNFISRFPLRVPIDVTYEGSTQYGASRGGATLTIQKY